MASLTTQKPADLVDTQEPEDFVDTVLWQLHKINPHNLIDKVMWHLCSTPFQCSKVTYLSNGLIHYAFRGKLRKPYSTKQTGRADDAATTVIVKYFLKRIDALDGDLKPIRSHASHESHMLWRLGRRPFKISGVDHPLAYDLIPGDWNISVLQDLPGLNNLWDVLNSPDNTKQSIAMRGVNAFAFNLGSWLRAFHRWSRDPTKLESWDDNATRRRFRYSTTYGTFLTILLDHFPDLVATVTLGHLQNVRDRELGDLVKTSGAVHSRDGRGDLGDRVDWGAMHGDFSIRNIMTNTHPAHASPHGKIYIVGFEFTQFGHHAHDLGQMIGEFYERWTILGDQVAQSAIEGLIQGYKRLGDNRFGFRVAIHVGVHLVCSYKRLPPHIPSDSALVRGVITTGREWITRAWCGDCDYFSNTTLAPLFTLKVEFQRPR